MLPGEYDGYVTSKQKLCTLDAKSTYCNCMTEMYTAGIWDPILDNYQHDGYLFRLFGPETHVVNSGVTGPKFTKFFLSYVREVEATGRSGREAFR